MRRLIAPPEPGIYPGVAADVYFAWDCASRSRLEKLRRSPAHMIAGDDKETDAMRFGRACHMAILEPEIFGVRYAAKKQCSAFTGNNERCKSQGSVLLESGDVVCKTHLREQPINLTTELMGVEEYGACQQMRARVAGKMRASGLIAGHGEFELSIVWDEAVVIDVDGLKVTVPVRCKARIDRFTAVGDGTIVDLKTTQDASRASFTKAIWDYSYHVQGGMYMRGARAVKLPAQHYVIMAVEKNAPWEAGVFRLTEGALDAGEQLSVALLRKYAHCQHTGVWPGYADVVEDISLPDWAWRKVDEELTELGEVQS